MMTLGFERHSETVGGRRVRRAVFEARSSLPVSAACVVANGIRDALTTLFGAPATLRLLEPLVPDPLGWEAIARDAQIFRVRGTTAEAAFVLRPCDALALVGAAFGETIAGARALSPIEHEVLARVMRSLAGTVAPVCGTGSVNSAGRAADIRGFVTYFEMLVERPAPLRIGIALSRDPLPEVRRSLRPEDLLDVEVEVTAQLAAGTVDAGIVLGLRPGVELPMMTKVGDVSLLVVQGTVVARAQAGVLGGRNAMLVTSPKGPWE